MDDEIAEAEAVPRVLDLHGRQRDPYTGNAMEAGQEGPNSIFYVPGMPSETAPDYCLYVGPDKTQSWTEFMQSLRNAGFKGTEITMMVTPRPQDRNRVPSPPPAQDNDRSDHRGVVISYASFWRTQCNYCWAVIRHREREAGFRLQEIKSAADKGCGVCSVLYNSITHFADIIFPRYSSSHVRVRQKVKERVPLLSDTESVRVSFDEYDGEDFFLTFSTGAKKATGFLLEGTKKRSHLAERIMTTASHDSITKVQQWLKICSEEHEQCLIPPESQLPMRVLEISNRRAKLIVSKGRVAPYVSLSHCWGVDPIIRLLKSNIEEMQKGVPWDKLSKTFQDAITIAWKLGFRYIWIDALCILQDSFEDWEYHASRMALVFADSQLTISASRSPDGSGGCFSYRDRDPWTLSSTGQQVHDPTLWLPYVQEGRDREGSMKVFTVSLKAPHGLYQHRRPKEPLLRRAWVFQEQVLCARNIHFASGELYFECKSYVACECSGWTARSLSYQWETRWRKAHAILLGNHNFKLPAVALQEARREIPKPRPIPKKAAEFEAYRALIEAYTRLDITNPHDRLPALSGITSGRKDTYLAGMWRSILLESLHWYPISVRGHPMAYRPDRYRAPTWSWASIESPIRFEETNFHWSNYTTKPVAQILDAYTVPEGLDPRGRVKDGVLKLLAPMAEATVREVGTTKRRWSDSPETLEYYAEHDPSVMDPSLVPRQDVGDIATYAALTVYGLQGREKDDVDPEKERPTMISIDCFLDQPLCCARIPPAEVVVGEQVMLLLLSSITCWVLKPLRTKYGYYKRVGIFQVKDRIFFRAKNDPIHIV